MTPFLSADKQAQATTADSPSAQELYNILHQELQCLQQVIAVLETENTAILEHEIKAIDHLLDKKLILLSKLDQLDKQRQQLFAQQTGISYSHYDFSHYISQYPDENIHSCWQAIKHLLPECKKQNELNGRMIAIRKENTEQILQILVGRPVNTPQTYSHSGQTQQQKRAALYTSV